MPVPIRKTLFVGLGGFGKDTLLCLRRKIYDEYDLSDIPALEYLVVDTDKAQSNYDTTLDSITQSLKFTRATDEQMGEFIDISVPPASLDKFFQMNVSDRIRDGMSWFPPELKNLGNNMLRHGAAGVRSFGKLGFLLNLLDKRVLHRELKDKLTRLIKLGAQDARWQEIKDRFVLDGNSPGVDIVFFASTVGGTGSGTFLDMAYLVRHLFLENRLLGGKDLEYLGGITLYFFLPDIIFNDPKAEQAFHEPPFWERYGIKDRQGFAKAGSYAALSELERFQLAQPEDFRFDRGWHESDAFVPDWDPFHRENGVITGPNKIFYKYSPFNWVFLISNRSASDHHLRGAEDAIEMVADKVFTLLVGEEQHLTYEGIRVNFTPISLPVALRFATASASRKYSQFYSGLGLSKIFVGERVIKRWAALYQACRFLAHLLGPSRIMDSQITAEVENVQQEFGWNVRDLFLKFSEEVLKSINSDFLHLNTSSDFFQKVSLDAEKSDCFGHLDALDGAYQAWLREFNGEVRLQEFRENLETILVKEGVQATSSYIECHIAKIKEEQNYVRREIKKDLHQEGFDKKIGSWIASQREHLRWVGLRNQPKEPQDIDAILKIARLTLEHLSQLKDIPPSAAYMVRTDLHKRFQENFLHDDCCGRWWSELVQDPDIIKGSIETLDGVKQGVHSTFKRILKKVDEAQNRIVEFLKTVLTTEISHSFEDALKILKNGDSKSQNKKDRVNGVDEDKLTIEQGSNLGSRNVYCGRVYQKTENLEHPNPDFGKINELLKRSFDISWTWQLPMKTKLAQSMVNVWLNLIIENGIADLKVKPSLKDYYESLGMRGDDTFKQDVEHCLKTCSPYIRYNDDFGYAAGTQKQEYVFTPRNMTEKVRSLLGVLAPNKDVRNYSGKELLFLSTDNIFPLPNLEIVKGLAETYEKFALQKAVWTRKWPPMELLPIRETCIDHLAVFLGIFLGNIRYNSSTRKYTMKLEKKRLRGVFEPVWLGDSIGDACSFFNSERAIDYVSPYERLLEMNEETMSSVEVLRKLTPLMEYIEKYYFPHGVSEGEIASHLEIVRKIIDIRDKNARRIFPLEDDFGRLNQETHKLYNWLHAFCDIVPIKKVNSSISPDMEWIPVLSQQFKDRTAKRVLTWHNEFFHPAGIDYNSAQPYKYAMSPSDDTPEGIDVAGWNERDPSIIPDYIMEYAWGDLAVRKIQAAPEGMNQFSEDVEGLGGPSPNLAPGHDGFEESKEEYVNDGDTDLAGGNNRDQKNEWE